MANEIREVTLPLPPIQAYELARLAGNEIPKYRNVLDDTQNFRMTWSKGWGWSNPVDIQLQIMQLDDQNTLLRYNANVLALADPFGILTSALNQFTTHLENHYQAQINHAPPPPPPVDNKAMKMNLVILAIVFGIIFLMFGGIFLAAIAG